MCASTEPYLHSIFRWPWSCHSSSSRVSFWVRIAMPASQSHCHNVSKQLNAMLGSLDLFNQTNSVHSQLCPTLCDPMGCSTPGLPVHRQLLEFTQIHVHGVSDAIQPSHPLLSPSPPAFNLPQHQGLFKWVNSLHHVAKALEFQLQHHPSNEYSGLISFKMDWLDFLAVQGTLKSLLQHHSSKASILQHSAFFIVQLSHPYMTTGKTIALTRQTFVGNCV